MTTKRGPYKRKYPLDATERTCRICQETKPVTAFAPNRERANGYVEVESRCYDCRNPYKRLHPYGINEDEFNALYESQNGKCGICEKELKSKFCIDHCHSTGQIRGLLCYACNSGLGQLGDNEESLLAALAYLRR
jgi:hypothetical protein